MNRIISINYNELRIDHDACSDMINQACRRPRSMLVSGVAVDHDGVFVCLEETGVSIPVYNFAPAEAHSSEELCAELSARYYAGFSTICSFILDDKRWVLYSSRKKDGVEGE